MTTININATDCGGVALSGEARFRLVTSYQVVAGTPPRIATHKEIPAALNEDGVGTVDLDAGSYKCTLPGGVYFAILIPDSAEEQDLADLITPSPTAATTGILIRGDDGLVYRLTVQIQDGYPVLSAPILVT